MSDTTGPTLTPTEQWWRRDGHRAATPAHQRRHLPGGRCYGGNEGGDVGHGTTASDGGQWAVVVVAAAADQVEVGESWMVVVASEI